MGAFAALRSAVRGLDGPLGRRRAVRSDEAALANPPKLVLRFGIYCALALTLAAVAVFWFMRQHATENAQQGVGLRARAVAYTLLREQLRPADFQRPVTEARRAELDALFARQVLVEGARTMRVTLWAADGTLVYSNVHALIGTRRGDASLRRALDGETVLDARRLAGVAGARSKPKVLTAYVPVRLTGDVRPSGMFEVSEDYAPVAREVRASVTPVAIVLALVLLGLYASLFPILRRVTRTLVSRNRCLAHQARALEQSLTEREEAERALHHKTAVLQLLEAVAVAANESATVEEATRICLDLVCDHTSWPVGHAFLRSSAPYREFAPTAIWHLDDPERFEPFRAATMSGPLQGDDALPARVLRSGQPVWVTDVTDDPAFPRAEHARRSGLRAAFAFPVLVGSDVAAVLEFFSTEAAEPDGPMLNVMAHVGTQLGRVIERTRVADEALRESEARFRAIFERAAVGILITDLDGRVTASNSTFQQMLGYADEELGRMVGAQLADPDDLAATAALAHDLASGARDHYQAERRYVRKDGQVVWGRVATSVVRGADGRPQFEVTMVENITGQKELEEQLRQSQKMEAVGRLAGGVAHDFNNLLTVISGYTDVLVSRAGDADPARPGLDAIRQAADQAAALTGQLLAFSRKQLLQPTVLDLNAVVSDTEAILQRLIGEDVALTAELEPELALVRADPGQIGQVLLNLAVNARDAMPDGGRLTISTSNADVGEAEARHLSVEPGRYVAITVRDTGQGMDEETQARIFEPFFTTKEPGQGTGLGLATVYGIVAQSGGSICVRSAIGEGSTFTVFLPRIGEGVLHQPPPADEPAAAKGTETVLLVEDETAVRILVRDVLADSGYIVLDARDADEALALCASHDGPVDAVLTDVVMPVMSGPALVGRLAQTRPGLMVIYMSGYTDEAVARDGVLEPGAAFLQKPFGMDVLLGTLREVLDGDREPARSNLKEVA